MPGISFRHQNLMKSPQKKARTSSVYVTIKDLWEVHNVGFSHLIKNCDIFSWYGFNTMLSSQGEYFHTQVYDKDLFMNNLFLKDIHHFDGTVGLSA